LDKVRAEYAEAGKAQPSEPQSLPFWKKLSMEMGEALINIFDKGRRDARVGERRQRGQLQ
jgi:hypothetical protein